MTMSKDRVEFKLPCNYSYSNPAKKVTKNQALIDATHKVLGLTREEMQKAIDGGWTIRCRPSQFARFLIIRNNAGLPNSFKELNPKLVPGTKDVLDVSERAFSS